jgi:hypothetical protein
MALQSFVEPWPLVISFLIVDRSIQSIGFLGQGMSPSPQCLYLHTGQHDHGINANTFMNLVGFEPTISAIKRTKTAYVLDRAATLIGLSN